MSEIDWSKAPKGATHYAPAIGSFRALWAKLESGEFKFYDEVVDNWYWGAQPLRSETFIQRPGAWNGTGLPPVGTVCEFYWGWNDWRVCTVFAHKSNANGKTDALVDLDGDWSFGTIEKDFRPIRTQEQIEAEEREREIQEMCDLLKAHRNSINGAMCEKLHGFGYRKQGEDK